MRVLVTGGTGVIGNGVIPQLIASGHVVRLLEGQHARAANVLDFVALKTVGTAAQSANWREVADRVVKMSGGEAPEIKEERRTLSAGEAARWEFSIRALVQERKRSTAGAPAEQTAQR